MPWEHILCPEATVLFEMSAHVLLCQVDGVGPPFPEAPGGPLLCPSLPVFASDEQAAPGMPLLKGTCLLHVRSPCSPEGGGYKAVCPVLSSEATSPSCSLYRGSSGIFGSWKRLG